MIDKTRIVDAVCERMKTLPVSHCLDLRTYKRNRSVVIAKVAEDDLLVIEDGFFKERFRIKGAKLRKLLKTLVKKEFPRSRKIRLYVLDRFSEDEVLKTKRKIL
jgi:molecular chaperone DnaK (HSP70)